MRGTFSDGPRFIMRRYAGMSRLFGNYCGLEQSQTQWISLDGNLCIMLSQIRRRKEWEMNRRRSLLSGSFYNLALTRRYVDETERHRFIARQGMAAEIQLNYCF